MGESMKGVLFERHAIVRAGLMGAGMRGMSLLGNLLAIEGVQVTAIYDPVPLNGERARRRVVDAGQPAPALYTGGEEGYQALCGRDDIDLVYISTPWELHVPMAVCAMEHGKHAAVEVPAATTIEGCWRLVDTAERTRQHCVMLENCCYGYNEMLVNRMVHAGLFGEVTHGEAAYIHDLREPLLADAGMSTWRRGPHMTRNGNLYPTHGLGPVAWYMDIDRGDRFDYLVSVSSTARGLTEFRDRHVPPGDPKRQERYICGDMNTSIIKTVRGRTILLQHDVVTPRPYDRNNLIAGPKGIFRDYPPRIYIDGQAGGEEWATIDTFKDEYEDPLWKQQGMLAREVGGHGGMDFLMNYRLIQCMREGLQPDMDVYDAAAWSVPGPLSDQSVAQGSAPVPFPDFTRGRWSI
ncbi:MAG TPA: Gfo/Idh/MocA family oxidoreductase [Herpetosiphonaceae bacterium]|nr:Gfo/Idh/MocA family oxidoreductase [Herpetosiphonaceae bacterium]